MVHRRLVTIESCVLVAFLVAVCPSAWAADEPTPGSLVPCPYTQEEIKSKLGLDVEPGITSDMQGPGAREVGCAYPVKNSFLVFAVQQTWDPNGASEPSESTMGIRRIAGDADGAVWLPAQGEDKPHVKLTYRRGKVRTDVDVYGSYFKEEEMTPKLEKLRRVP